MTTTKTILDTHLINVLSDIVLDYTRGDEINNARAATLNAIKQIEAFDADLLEDGYTREHLPNPVYEIVEALHFHLEHGKRQDQFWNIQRGLKTHFFGPDYDSSEDEYSSDDDE